MRRFTLVLVAAIMSLGFASDVRAQASEKPTPKDKSATKATAKAKSQEKTKTAKKAAIDQPKPTMSNVAYGDHPRQVLDFYQAKSDKPTPLVIYIHGGGWVNGDKERVSTIDLKKMLAEGISVASINYRYTTQAQEAGIKPPVKAPLEDAARAVQFLRSKASEWNIDKSRLGATGGSAGACSSLWLLYHDDLAKPDSSDPVARESTRLSCAAVVGAQTSLDPKQLREWMPNMKYGGHAFGFRQAGNTGRDAEFQRFYDHRDEVLSWIKEYSPYENVGPGDPPVYLDYPSQDKPAKYGETQKDPTHSAVLGLGLKEQAEKFQCEARLSYPGSKDPDFKNGTEFLISKLKAAK